MCNEQKPADRIAENAIISGIALLLMAIAFILLGVKHNLGGLIGALIGPYIGDLWTSRKAA